MSQYAPETDTSDLSVKLNELFDIMRKPSQPPLSNAAAAEVITATTGVSISDAYLWQLPPVRTAEG